MKKATYIFLPKIVAILQIGEGLSVRLGKVYENMKTCFVLDASYNDAIIINHVLQFDAMRKY